MTDSKVIEKLRKLLALTESNNEHEALAAARRLHAMLAKHNISMSDLDRKEDTLGQEYIVTVTRPWKQLVAQSIARLYFCEFYVCRLGGSKAQFFFVGTEANRMFAMHIFQMVVTTVERESRRESKKLYGKENSGFVNSFWSGAQVRIGERCNELIQSAKEGSLQDEDGTFLPVMLNTYDLAVKQTQQWIQDNLTGLKQRPTRLKCSDTAGWQAGQNTGDKVQLSRALQSKNSTKLLGD